MTALVWENYTTLEVVAEGGFSTSFRCKEKNNDHTIVLLKRINELASKQEKRDKAVKEAERLMALSSSTGMSKALGYFIRDQHFFLVMEHFDNARSLKIVSEERSMRRSDGLSVLSAGELVVLTVELLDVLYLLHSRSPSVRHGDIRPESIVSVSFPPEELPLSRSKDSTWFRLIDFGAALLDTDTVMNTFQGFNVHFISPELTAKIEGRDHKKLTEKSDMWSLGATLLTLAVGVKVRDGGSAVMKHLRHGTWTFSECVLTKFTPVQKTLWDNMHPIVRDTIQRCLMLAPEERASVVDLRKHPLYVASAPLVALLKRSLITPEALFLLDDSENALVGNDGYNGHEGRELGRKHSSMHLMQTQAAPYSSLGGDANAAASSTATELATMDVLFQRSLCGDVEAMQSLKTKAYLGSNEAEAFLLVLSFDQPQHAMQASQTAQNNARTVLLPWLRQLQQQQAQLEKDQGFAGTPLSTQQKQQQGLHYVDYLVAKLYQNGLAEDHNASVAEVNFSSSVSSSATAAAVAKKAQDQERIVVLYARAAALDYAPAQYELGRCFEEGQGVPQRDFVVAASWFQRAADQNFAPAQYYVGHCYTNDTICEANNDYNAAFPCFLQAAQQGYMPALYRVGDCYRRGLGTPQNLMEAQRCFLAAANQGHAQAMCEVARMLLEDLDSIINRPATQSQLSEPQQREAEGTALRWLQQAAAQNCTEAFFQLGCLTQSGRLAAVGLAKDKSAALQHFKTAAQEHHMAAQYQLALCYYSGRGIDRSLEAAVIWFERAAQGGFVEAQFHLAYCFEKGEGVGPQDLKEAMHWYRAAASQGYAPAQNALANLLKSTLTGGNEAQRSLALDNNTAAEILYLYEQAAAQNLAAAQYNLGLCFFYGALGVQKDVSRAIGYFHQAADQNYAPAWHNLGVFYKQGQGVPRDLYESCNCFRKAAESGLAAAQYSLGLGYFHGHVHAPTGPPLTLEQRDEDLRTAFYWCSLAAQQGHAAAQCWLGNAWAIGQGTTVDHIQAVLWYRTAAEQGHAKAQYSLGNCYFYGQGVAHDMQQAEYWYRLSAAQGDDEAIAALHIPVSGEGPQGGIVTIGGANNDDNISVLSSGSANSYIQSSSSVRSSTSAAKSSKGASKPVVATASASEPKKLTAKPSLLGFGSFWNGWTSRSATPSAPTKPEATTAVDPRESLTQLDTTSNDDDSPLDRLTDIVGAGVSSHGYSPTRSIGQQSPTSPSIAGRGGSNGVGGFFFSNTGGIADITHVDVDDGDEHYYSSDDDDDDDEDDDNHNLGSSQMGSPEKTSPNPRSPDRPISGRLSGINLVPLHSTPSMQSMLSATNSATNSPKHSRAASPDHQHTQHHAQMMYQPHNPLIHSQTNSQHNSFYSMAISPPNGSAASSHENSFSEPDSGAGGGGGGRLMGDGIAHHDSSSAGGSVVGVEEDDEDEDEAHAFTEDDVDFSKSSPTKPGTTGSGRLSTSTATPTTNTSASTTSRSASRLTPSSPRGKASGSVRSLAAAYNSAGHRQPSTGGSTSSISVRPVLKINSVDANNSSSSPAPKLSPSKPITPSSSFSSSTPGIGLTKRKSTGSTTNPSSSMSPSSSFTSPSATSSTTTGQLSSVGSSSALKKKKHPLLPPTHPSSTPSHSASANNMTSISPRSHFDNNSHNNTGNQNYHHKSASSSPRNADHSQNNQDVLASVAPKSRAQQLLMQDSREEGDLFQELPAGQGGYEEEDKTDEEQEKAGR